MWFFLKMLFPKLWFGIDGDPEAAGQDPNGQPGSQDDGNDPDPSGESTETTPTEFIEVKGVKIPASEFEELARNKYKDRFEAYDNREKWQAENTRRAQELKQLERDAEAYRRLQSDPINAKPQQRQDPQKMAYVAKKLQSFPDVDPRFFEAQYDDLQEALGPIHQERAESFEKRFLDAHPDVKKGDEKYYKIGEYISKGYDPEDAYNLVYANEIKEKEFQDRIKARDEEARRKLQQSRTTSQNATKPKGDPSDRAWAIIQKFKQTA